jgi:hypothetical protein
MVQTGDWPIGAASINLSCKQLLISVTLKFVCSSPRRMIAATLNRAAFLEVLSDDFWYIVQC